MDFNLTEDEMSKIAALRADGKRMQSVVKYIWYGHIQERYSKDGAAIWEDVHPYTMRADEHPQHFHECEAYSFEQAIENLRVHREVTLDDQEYSLKIVYEAQIIEKF